MEDGLVDLSEMIERIKRRRKDTHLEEWILNEKKLNETKCFPYHHERQGGMTARVTLAGLCNLEEIPINNMRPKSRSFASTDHRIFLND